MSNETLVELRPVVLADAALIWEAWGQRAENFTYLTAPVFARVDDARHYVAALFHTPESVAFHVVDPHGAVVGLIKAGITGHRAQVGYVIDQACWGRGFATDAVRQIVALLEKRPTISRIWATCALENVASTRVLEKAGFTREAVLKNWVTYPAQGNQAFDNYSYVRLPAAAG